MAPNSRSAGRVAWRRHLVVKDATFTSMNVLAAHVGIAVDRLWGRADEIEKTLARYLNFADAVDELGSVVSDDWSLYPTLFQVGVMVGQAKDDVDLAAMRKDAVEHSGPDREDQEDAMGLTPAAMALASGLASAQAQAIAAGDTSWGGDGFRGLARFLAAVGVLSGELSVG